MAEHRAFKVIQGGVSHAPMPKPTSLKARAVDLLVQREYSRQALQEKLLSEQASAEDVAQAQCRDDPGHPKQ